MQRRTSRTLSRAVIVAVILAVGATIWQSWTAGMPGMSGVVATQWGPLSPADRDLIVKVRLACLWEMSTGQQVQQQATNPAVKEAGRKISAEHTELDQKTRDIADKLGVPLPASPNAQQIGWMKEIASKTGSDYDRTAVQRLREAHGIVLPILAEVRISTRNDLVRAVRRRRHAVRHPAHRLPGVHRAGRLLRAARAAVARPAVRFGELDRPARAGPRPHRLPAGRHPDRREPARAGARRARPARAAADGDHVRSPGGHGRRAHRAAGGGQHGPVGDVAPTGLATGDVAGHTAGRDPRRPDPGRRYPEIPDHRQRTPRRPSLAAHRSNAATTRAARSPLRRAPRAAAPQLPAPTRRSTQSALPHFAPQRPLPTARPSGHGPNPDRGTRCSSTPRPAPGASAASSPSRRPRSP